MFLLKTKISPHSLKKVYHDIKTDKKESLLDKLLGKDKEKTELEKKQEELESMGEKDAFKKNLEDKKGNNSRIFNTNIVNK